MKYELLSSLFYQDSQKYSDVYSERINNESTFKINLDINGYQGFVVVNRDISLLITQIHKMDKDITVSLPHLLPDMANLFLLQATLVDEIMITNDIEGIYSTRQEITDILDDRNNDKKARLNGLIKKYVALMRKNDIALENAQDFRKLYDDIILNEIPKKDLPDGEIFRKGSVNIHSVTDKIKHKGLYPESKIIDAVESLLNVTYDESIPGLIRIAVCHYMMGYIHAFYDGNGRLSRFVSSYLLIKNGFQKLVAINLSYAIKDNKNAYYKAFDICNDEKNKGDLTPFVIMFLDAIKKAILHLDEKIKQSKTKLDYYNGLIKTIPVEKSVERDVISVLMQNSLFNYTGISIESLAEKTNRSESFIRSVLKSETLSKMPIESEKSGRTNLYKLNLDKFEKLCVSTSEPQ